MAKSLKNKAASKTLATTLVALSAFSLHGQAHAAAENLNIQAVIINATQTIVATRDLLFGNLIAGPGGTVVVAPNGTPTYNGPSAAGGTIQAGRLLLVDGIGTPVTVTVDPTATLNSTGDSMTVNNFNIDGLGGRTITVTIGGGGGSTQLPIGATLNVGGTQATGSYTGTVNVTTNW